MMKKLTPYIVILIIAVAVGAWYYWLKPFSKDTRSSVSVSVGPLIENYNNEKYNFSFKYPKGYTVTTFVDSEDESADIVLLQAEAVSNPSSVSNNPLPGFQVKISPVDEDINFLSIERIKKDLPDIIIKDPQEVILGDEAKAGKGVAFKSESDEFAGESREVWFIFNKNLYQIRTYIAYDNLVQAVLGSWKFK